MYFSEMHVGKNIKKLFLERKYLYHNFRSLIAWGNSGNFISFICWGMFIFFTADIALVGAADRPAYKGIEIKFTISESSEADWIILFTE